MSALSPTRTAVVAHLTPVTAVLALALGRHDPFVRGHARAALRFHLSLALYFGLIYGALHLTRGTLIAVQLVPFLLFVNLMLVLNWALFTVIAIHRAATGRPFTYPMTIGRI
jgi:uncharacterized Tic20 family protein